MKTVEFVVSAITIVSLFSSGFLFWKGIQKVDAPAENFSWRQLIDKNRNVRESPKGLLLAEGFLIFLITLFFNVVFWMRMRGG